MAPWKLGLQASAGFLFSILLGWLSIAGLIALSIWFADLRFVADSTWIGYIVFLVWLAYVPMVSFAMGVLCAFCWQNQQWDVDARHRMTAGFSWLFWVASFPITILLICSCVGLIVFPIQIVCHSAGVERGMLWIKTRALEQFLGKRNDWEREVQQ